MDISIHCYLIFHESLTRYIQISRLIHRQSCALPNTSDGPVLGPKLPKPDFKINRSVNEDTWWYSMHSFRKTTPWPDSYVIRTTYSERCSTISISSSWGWYPWLHLLRPVPDQGTLTPEDLHWWNFGWWITFDLDTLRPHPSPNCAHTICMGSTRPQAVQKFA